MGYRSEKWKLSRSITDLVNVPGGQTTIGWLSPASNGLHSDFRGNSTCYTGRVCSMLHGDAQTPSGSSSYPHPGPDADPGLLTLATDVVPAGTTGVQLHDFFVQRVPFWSAVSGSEHDKNNQS